MKRLSHNVEKLPGDRCRVTAAWKNQMRMPAKVTITTDVPPGMTPEQGTLIEGDSACVYHTLEGLAQIAWEMGWRPAGLSNTVAAVVASYKLPVAS